MKSHNSVLPRLKTRIAAVTTTHNRLIAGGRDTFRAPVDGQPDPFTRMLGARFTSHGEQQEGSVGVLDRERDPPVRGRAGRVLAGTVHVETIGLDVPSLQALSREGEYGRQRLNQYTRYLTIALAVLQSTGIIDVNGVLSSCEQMPMNSSRIGSSTR